MSIRWAPTLIFAVVVAFLGAHFAEIREVPAGGPFVFTPPPSFAPVTMPNAQPGVEKVWVEPTSVSLLDARVTQTHSPHVPVLEDAALVAIAAGLPALYEKSQGQWTESRHLVHIRPDGGKVGLIVGDLTTANGVHMQTMQMLFPDDTGASIVTASFDHASAQRLSPEFEKSLDDATGIKKLGKPAPGWLYLTYGLGAFLVALALQMIVARRAKT